MPRYEISHTAIVVAKNEEDAKQIYVDDWRCGLMGVKEVKAKEVKQEQKK